MFVVSPFSEVPGNHLDAVDELQVPKISDSNEGLENEREKKRPETN